MIWLVACFAILVFIYCSVLLYKWSKPVSKIEEIYQDKTKMIFIDKIIDATISDTMIWKTDKGFSNSYFCVYKKQKYLLYSNYGLKLKLNNIEINDIVAPNLINLKNCIKNNIYRNKLSREKEIINKLQKDFE